MDGFKAPRNTFAAPDPLGRLAPQGIASLMVYKQMCVGGFLGHNIDEQKNTIPCGNFCFSRLTSGSVGQTVTPTVCLHSVFFSAKLSHLVHSGPDCSTIS